MRLWVDNEVVQRGRWVSIIRCRCGKKIPVDLSAYREQQLFTDIELPKCECGHLILSYTH